MRQGSEYATVNAPSALAAGAMLSALTALVINLQPIIMGALATDRRLDDAALGHVSAIFIGFHTLCLLTSPVWVRSVNWRLASVIGIAVTALIALSGVWLASQTSIMLLFAAIGVSTGGIAAVSFASLGDNRDPDRAYGASITAQALLAAVVAMPLSGWIVPSYGIEGLFVSLAAVCACGFLACPWMPKRGVAARPAPLGETKPPSAFVGTLPASVALLASMVFVGGILGFWYFMERIGSTRGASPPLIGLVISLCSLSTIASASLVAWLGARFTSLTYVMAGSLMVVAGYSILGLHGNVAYVVAAQLFALGWGLAQPAYYAAIRKVDASGRLFVLAPASAGAAGVIVGIVAGPVIQTGGYWMLIVFSSGLIVLAAAILFLSVRLTPSRTAGLGDTGLALAPALDADMLVTDVSVALRRGEWR